MAMVSKWRFQIDGGHVHVDVFTAPEKDRTFAKCGELTFSIEEWPQVKEAFSTIDARVMLVIIDEWD